MEALGVSRSVQCKSMSYPRRSSVCLASAQVVTFDKVAERAQLLQEMKDMWPSKCQDANEKLITSLKAKLGAAENKCAGFLLCCCAASAVAQAPG